MMKRNEEHIWIKIVFSVVSFIMAFIGIGLVIYAIVRGKNHDFLYRAAVLAWVLIFVIINDIIQAVVDGNLNNKIKDGYAIYVLLDLAAMLSLGFFSINADNLLSTGCCLSFVLFVVFTCAKVYVSRILSQGEAMDYVDESENIFIYKSNQQDTYSDKQKFPDPQLFNDRFADDAATKEETEIQTYTRK